MFCRMASPRLWVVQEDIFAFHSISGQTAFLRQEPSHKKQHAETIEQPFSGLFGQSRIQQTIQGTYL